MKAYAFCIKISVKELLNTQIDIFSPLGQRQRIFEGLFIWGEKRLASVDFDW